MKKARKHRFWRMLSWFLAIVMILSMTGSQGSFALASDVEENNDVQVTISLKNGENTLTVQDGASLTISENGTPITVSDNNNGTFSCTLTKGVAYSYTASGTYYEIKSDSFTFDGSNTVELAVGAPFVKTSFNVTGDIGASITDAAITVTDSSSAEVAKAGDNTWHLTPGETYSYTVSKENYETATGSITAQGTPGETTIDVAMESITKDITFNVQLDSGDFTQQPKITLTNNTTQKSEEKNIENGAATFRVNMNCDYSYAVTYSGYPEVTDKLDLSQDRIVVSLIFPDINISIAPPSDGNNYTTGEKITLSVIDPVEGAEYEWKSSSLSIAGFEVDGSVVDSPKGTSVTVITGKELATASETATITVSSGSKSQSVTINVNRKTVSILNLSATALGTADPAGDNATGVKLSFSGLPADATGTVTFYRTTKNGEYAELLGSSDVGNGACFIDIESDNIVSLLQKGIWFKAEYSGDKNYSSVEAKIEEEVQYYQTKQLELSEEFKKDPDGNPEVENAYWSTEENDGVRIDVLNIDYETYKESGINIGLNNDTVLGQTLTYSIDSGEFSLFDSTELQNGTLKPNDLGSATVTVTREEDQTEGWRGSSLSFKVVVTKTIGVDELTWTPLEVIYAGQKGQTFDITGTYKGDGLEGSEALSVTVRTVVAKVDENDTFTETDANAGKYSTLKIVNGNSDEDGINPVSTNENNGGVFYKLDLASFSGNNLNIKSTQTLVTIKEKQLDVKVVNKKASDDSPKFTYEKDVKTEIDDLVETDGVIKLKDPTQIVVDDKGNDDRDVVDKAVSNVKVKVAGSAEDITKYAVMTYPGVVQPILKDADGNEALVNYKLACAEEDYGNLIIEEYDINKEDIKILDLINISGDNAIVYTDENKSDIAHIWIKNGGTISASPNSQNARAAEYDQVMLAEGTGENTIDISKTPFEWSEDSGVDKSKTFEFYLNDSDDTTKATKTKSKTIKIYGDTEAPIVTFDEGKTKTHTIDGVLEAITFGMYSNEKYALSFRVDDGEGSGVQDFSYYIWHLDSEAGDVQSGEITAEKIKEKIDSLSPDDWKSCSGDSATVEVPASDAAAYLILVKASDNVNNTKIYASNGIIIEKVVPSVQIEGVSGGIYGKTDKITYTIKATDGKYEDADTKEELGVSGIQRIETEILCDGKSEEHKTFYANPNTGEFQDTEFKETTPAPEGKTYSQTMELSSEYDSNNIVIRVTAYDRAGNTQVVTQPVKVDRQSPEIHIKYSNNNAANGIYFQAARTATITFTERNFNPEKVRFNLTLENGGEYKDVSLETLNSIEGISAAWGTDSQSGYESEQYTDKRTNVATIVFSGDNKYSHFSVQCTDNAGNANNPVEYDTSTAAGTENTFVIDTVDPVINVQYYADGKLINPGKTENDRIYKNSTVDAVITITEHNFSMDDSFVEGQISYSVSAAKVGSENGEIPDYQAQAGTVGNWTSVADTRTSSNFVYSIDGNYVTGFTYTDLSGRKATWTNDYFTVDKTAPTGEIVIQEGTTVRDRLAQFLEKITFGLYSNKALEVTMSSADATSPLKPDKYYKAYEPMDLQSLKNMSENQWTAGNRFTVASDEQFVPYMKIEDMAGNVSYISSSEIAVVDTKNPLNKDTGKPVITITANEPAHGIYNGDVPFHISVEDPVAGNTYSGLASVTYEIIKDDGAAPTQEETFTYSTTERTRSVDYDRIVNAAANNSNNVKIKVTAIDNAGNQTTETKDIKIDITKPEISIVFDNNAPLNGKCYKDTRTATVTVTERNFDESAFRFAITNTDGTQPVISGWSHSANSGVSDEATHTCTVTFAADGDYTMSASCTDLAGNSQESEAVPEFTIDKTLPTVNVTYNNNSAQNGKYYKEARTATITITEHNFRASDVRVTTTASLNGASISAPTVSGWSTSGDRHTAMITYGRDGDFTFDIAYSDLAGNAMADYSQDSFTVDMTEPEVEITGVKNKSANKGTVAPVIRISDTNYSADNVTLTLTGANKGKVSVDSLVSRTTMANGQTITFRNFGSNMDDIYTLTAKSVDRAGNETSKSITFSVNRNGSTYIISEATQKLLDTGFTNNPQDIVISEINVDTLEFIELTYSKDGQVVKLKEGTDYTVKEEGGSGQWKKYTYTIKASCFSEEGEYSINIYSEDRASNTTTNKVKEKAIEFIVDKTPPTVSIANLENRGRYRANAHEFTLSVKDNTVLSYVELYLDGQLVHTYMADELEVVDGQLTITVDSKNEFQTVKLIAYDAAGNPTEPMEYEVLVTANWWVQFFANKPLFFGCIAALVVLIGAIALLAARRSRKNTK